MVAVWATAHKTNPSLRVELWYGFSNPVSPNLITLVPQLRGYQFVEFDQYYNPKYFIDQAAPRFELGVKDLQSPALPLGHAAKKSDLKSRKEQVFIHIFLLITKTFFSFILNLILLTFLESFSKNRFLLFWIQFRLFSSMDSILKHTLLTLENFPLLSILLR